MDQPKSKRDRSLHRTHGKVFQMFHADSGTPMPFSEAKHNYTKKDLDRLEVGQSMTFMPMFGNKNPVYSKVTRIE